jgi:cobyrinic acid a,c-diamide synthase
VAQITKTPSILVVNAGGMGNSVGAVIRGFCDYVGDSGLRGVVFNNVSAAMYERLRGLADKSGVVPLGFLPREAGLAFRSRQLGLVRPQEDPAMAEKLERLGKLAQECLDLDGVVALAQSAGGLSRPAGCALEAGAGAGYESGMVEGLKAGVATGLEVGAVAGLEGAAVTALEKYHVHATSVAVAKDEAFCFYYEENLEMLRQLGCEIVYFSPLRDGALPEKAGGLYLGGGYPELYSEALSANRPLIADLRRQITAGLPTIAEGGGFAYLHESMDGFPMVGVAPGKVTKADALQSIGYTFMTALSDGLVLSEGDSLRCHEFHYWQSDAPGASLNATKAGSGKSSLCGFTSSSMYTAFPQLYFPAKPDVARRFVVKAAGYRDSGEQLGRP